MAEPSPVVILCLVHILLFIASINGETDTSLTRKVTSEFRCKDYKEKTSVVHSKAEGSNDTLHYVFSTLGVPTILVVRTDRSGELNISCSDFFGNMTDMANSITVTHRHYAYAVMFNKLLEYDDTDDVADMTKLKGNTSWHIHDLATLHWSEFNEEDVHNNTVKFVLDQPTDSLNFFENGSLSMQVALHGKYYRDPLLPHLEYNANMTMFDLILDNINSSFSRARFALEMTMVSMDGVPNTMDIRTTTYIDDEHSPGVFQMIDWTSKGTKQDWSGFFQFKPVCYTNSERSLNDATKALFYDLRTPNWTTVQPPPSVAYAYFGQGMYEYNYSMTMTNVSFGLSRDKFYTKTNYTVWSASVGFGTPPADEVSLVIIIVLSIGLGLPIVLILFGSIGICVKKKRAAGAYEEITSDDPTLN